MESILQHLSTCLGYDMSPRSFLEKYLVTAPVLQVIIRIVKFFYVILRWHKMSPIPLKIIKWMYQYLPGTYHDILVAERSGAEPSAVLGPNLWYHAVSLHQGRHRLPAAPGRRVPPLLRPRPPPPGHHRGDYRPQIQQVCPAHELGNFGLNWVEDHPWKAVYESTQREEWIMNTSNWHVTPVQYCETRHVLKRLIE